MKKFLSFILAAALALTVGLPVFAADTAISFTTVSAAEAYSGEKLTVSGAITVSQAISDATLTILCESVKVGEKTLGNLSADTNFTAEFSVSEILGKNSYTLRLDYTENGVKKSATDSFTVETLEKETVSIIDFRFPYTTSAGEKNTVTFNIVNKGDEACTDMQAYIYDGEKLLGTSYIGRAEAHGMTAVSVDFVCPVAGNYDLNMRLLYNDGTQRMTRDKNFVLRCESAKTKLVFRNVSKPGSVEAGGEVNMSFDIVNEGDAVAKDVRVYLTDALSAYADDISLGDIAGNSSASHTFTFKVQGSGRKSYTLTVYSKDADNQWVTSSETVSFTVGSSSVGGQGGTAKLKIAKLENPNVIYCGVKTDIPYSIVNTGKDAGNNCEVYITDERGNELAREYIGSVMPSSKYDGVIAVKFASADERTLKINVSWENPDERTVSTNKEFEQKVAEYRLTVGELTGAEWVYEGEPVTLSFNIANLGAMGLYNAQARLIDQDGNGLASSFIGSVSPNSKLENQRFKKVLIGTNVTGVKIEFTYEDDNGAQYAVNSDLFPVTVQSNIVPDFPIDPIDPIDPVIEPETNGTPWWVWLIAVGGVAVVAVVVVTVVVKRKKKQDKSDDLDYFYAQKK